MTELARLIDEARRLVSEPLMRGTLARPKPEHQLSLVEPLGRSIELDALDETVDRILRTTEQFDTKIDALAAPDIHRALPLSRREAADPGVWRFLAVISRPDFVRHRWEYRARSTMVARFWNFGTRPDSNAFCRLWWIAELTARERATTAERDYGLTEKVLALQTTANALFVRNVSAYTPAVEAFVDAFGDADSDMIERAIKRFSAWLSTVPIEGRSAAQLRAVLDEIRSQLE